MIIAQNDDEGDIECYVILKKRKDIKKINEDELENQGIIKTYNQLIEKSHKPVAQSEHTVIITEKNGKREVIVTTREN